MKPLDNSQKECWFKAQAKKPKRAGILLILLVKELVGHYGFVEMERGSVKNLGAFLNYEFWRRARNS